VSLTRNKTYPRRENGSSAYPIKMAMNTSSSTRSRCYTVSCPHCTHARAIAFHNLSLNLTRILMRIAKYPIFNRSLLHYHHRNNKFDHFLHHTSSINHANNTNNNMASGRGSVSVVIKLLKLQAGWYWLDSGQENGHFFFSLHSYWLWGNPIHLSNRYRSSFPGCIAARTKS
jgi:hypothetical protein